MSILIDLKVAELLCSRLCHELINPVGAVSNGAELIAEFGNGPDPEAVALIGQSARAAAQRLQFYRMAYGLASGVSTDLTIAEAGAFAEGMMESGRLRLEWPRSGRGGEWRPGRAALKLLLNLLLLAVEALPRGGRVVLGATSAGGRIDLTVQAAGEQAGLGRETLAAFRGDAAVEDLTARTAHAYFTGRLAARGGLPIALEEAPDSLTFRLALPAQG